MPARFEEVTYLGLSGIPKSFDALACLLRSLCVYIIQRWIMQIHPWVPNCSPAQPDKADLPLNLQYSQMFHRI